MLLKARILEQHRPTPKKAPLDLDRVLGMLFASKADLKQIDLEIADFAQCLGLLLGNGLPVNVAIGWLAPRASGLIATEFQKITLSLDLGADLLAELAKLSKRLPNQQLVELCEKLSVAILRGAPVSSQVISQAGAARAMLHRQLLKQAGSNETKMLIPVILLILPVTVLFAIFPSIMLLSAKW